MAGTSGAHRGARLAAGVAAGSAVALAVAHAAPAVTRRGCPWLPNVLTSNVEPYV